MADGLKVVVDQPTAGGPLAFNAPAEGGGLPPLRPSIRSALAGLSPQSRMNLAHMMALEGADSPDDMQAVMEVAINRALNSGQTLDQVLNTQGAFTSLGPMGGGRQPSARQMQAAFRIIDNPNPGVNIDPDVVDFANVDYLRQQVAKGTPGYSAKTLAALEARKPYAKYGAQTFYKGHYGGGKQMAPGVGTANATGSGDATAMPANPFALPPDQQAMVNEDIAESHALTKDVLAGYDKRAGIYDTQLAALAKEQERQDEMYDRFHAANKTLIDGMPDQFKMQQQALLQVSDQPMNPSRVLGQFLPMMAILGGAFTKAGAVGSLKAAAAAANAARGHDEDAFKRANDEFKNQLQEVMDKATLVHQELTEGIAQSQGNVQNILAAGNIAAAKFDIPALKQAALQGDAQAIIAAQANMTKGITELMALQKSMAELKKTEMETANLAASQLDDDTFKYFAAAGNFNVPGAPHLPAGFGMGMTPQKAEMAREAARQAQKDWGYTDAKGKFHPADPETAARLQTAANVGARGQAQAYVGLTKAIAATQGFLGTMDNIIDQATPLVSQAAGPGWGPFWNRPIQWLKANTGMMGKDQANKVVQLNALIGTIADEYGRLRQSSPSGGIHLTDRMAEVVEAIISPNLTPSQLMGLFTTFKQEGQNRLAGYKNAANETQDNISNAIVTAQSQQLGTDADGNPIYAPRPHAYPSDQTQPTNPGGKPDQPPPPSGLKEGEKGQWVQDVEVLRKWLRKNPGGKAFARQRLKQEHPDASDAQLDAAFQ